MNKKGLAKTLDLIKDAPYVKDLSYIEYKEKGHRALAVENELQSPVYRFKVDIPILICKTECAKALGVKLSEIDDILDYKRGLVLSKRGFRSNLLRNAIRKEKEGGVVYYGSRALIMQMEENGVESDGFFVSEIPILARVLERKDNENFFEDDISERAYRVILRNARRKLLLKSNAPALINQVESKLLERAVREYFACLEEKGIF